MLQKKLENKFSKINEVVLDILWVHWNRIGFFGQGKVLTVTIDPEVLILLTALFGYKERRLFSAMESWLRRYCDIVVVERLLALSAVAEDLFTRDIYNSKQVFEQVVEQLPATSKASWKRMGCKKSKPEKRMTREDDKKIRDHDWVIKNNKLLTYRYLFGCNSKADILYFAEVFFEQPPLPHVWNFSASDLSKTLCYNHSTVYRALIDLEKAACLQEVPKSSVGKNKIYEKSRALKIERLTEKTNNIQDRCIVSWQGLMHIILDLFKLEKSVSEIDHEDPIKKRLLKSIYNIDNCFLINSLVDIKGDIAWEQMDFNQITIDELLNYLVQRVTQLYQYLTS